MIRRRDTLSNAEAQARTSAADTAIGSAQMTLAVLLGALALLGPPALVAIAAILLWRRFRPRRGIRPAAAETSD